MRVADATVNTTVSQQTQPGFPCEPAPELLLTRWGSVGSSFFGRLALRRVRLGAAEKAEEEFPRLPREPLRGSGSACAPLASGSLAVRFLTTARLNTCLAVQGSRVCLVSGRARWATPAPSSSEPLSFRDGCREGGYQAGIPACLQGKARSKRKGLGGR